MLVIVAVVSHVLNGGLTDFLVLGLVSIELVGKSVEQTVTCMKEPLSADCPVKDGGGERVLIPFPVVSTT